MDVGIRQLKQHLSEYIEKAARGEVARITDRGKLKAILGPAFDSSQRESGIAEGWIGAARSVQPPATIRRQRSELTIAAALTDDRGD